MKRGTKPLPTALKLLKGTQPCRVNLDAPAPPSGEPEPPAYLDEKALEFWREHAPMLLGMGVLTAADRHILALLCESYSRVRKTPDDKACRDEFRKLCAEFGLSPSSRSGLKAEPAKPRDKLAELMARKAK
jgi:phage terminase small subunit